MAHKRASSPPHVVIRLLVAVLPVAAGLLTAASVPAAALAFIVTTVQQVEGLFEQRMRQEERVRISGQQGTPVYHCFPAPTHFSGEAQSVLSHPYSAGHA